MLDVFPSRLYATSVPDTVSIALSLGNIPRLARPFTLADVMVKVGEGEYLPVAKITASDRVRTKVSL